MVNLGLGAGWDNFNENDAKQGLIYAVENGVNIFDTADVYGFGQSERLLGWLINTVINQSLLMRDQIVVATKVGYFQGCAAHGFDALHMRHQLEMSLKNLGVDYIDIYFFHHLDFGENDEYLAAAVDAMKNFKDLGLIRFIGLRGPHKFSILRGTKDDFKKGGYQNFLELAELINPDIVSVRYNMITNTYNEEDTDIFKWVEKNNLGIFIYKPLGQGLLLNKYNPNSPPVFSKADHRNRKKWFGKNGLTVLKQKLEILASEFSCKNVKDFAQLAIRYCTSRSKNACVFTGFRNKEQLEDTLLTTGSMSLEQQQAIQGIFKNISKEIGNFIEVK